MPTSYNYELIVDCDGETETLAIIAYLLKEGAHVVGLTKHFDDDELTDDQTAEDISQFLGRGLAIVDNERVGTLTTEIQEFLNNPGLTSEMVTGMIADVRGVQSQMTGNNAAMRVLDSMIASLEARLTDVQAYEEHNRDDAPPNGITRPRIIHGPDWPTEYWVDTSSNPTQGSGRHHPGLEMVPCLECHAPIGEVCITGSHGRYRRGFGHASRRRDARAAQGLSS